MMAYRHPAYESQLMVSMISPLLAQALSTWQDWAVEHPIPPEYLHQLTLGHTNKSHVVRMGERRYVIRLNEQGPCTLAVNRYHERRIMTALSSTAIAPTIVYPSIYDTCHSSYFTVFEYIEGPTWTINDFMNEYNQHRLSQKIDAYKHIVVNLPRFDYVHCLQNYWKEITQQGILIDPRIASKFMAFIPILASFLSHPYTPVLSHHDLNPDNIIETQQGLMILDWEYAGMGHPDFDTEYIKKNMSSVSDLKTSIKEVLACENKSPIEQLIDWLTYLWLVLR